MFDPPHLTIWISLASKIVHLITIPVVLCLDCVPVELEDPFYRDQYDQEHVKPPVVSLLLSAELYCRAGSLILRSDAAKPLLGHNAVIQALAQKGLYVTDQERLVTERDLCKTPIQMASHLILHLHLFLLQNWHTFRFRV